MQIQEEVHEATGQSSPSYDSLSQHVPSFTLKYRLCSSSVCQCRSQSPPPSPPPPSSASSPLFAATGAPSRTNKVIKEHLRKLSKFSGKNFCEPDDLLKNGSREAEWRRDREKI